MSKITTTTHPCLYRFWHLTVRDLLVLLASVVLGLSYGILERDVYSGEAMFSLWYSGALAMFSLWIVLGLVAQVHDLWGSSEGIRALSSEERWGWRFAIAWRLAIACLMGAYFLVRLLVTSKVLRLDIGDNLSLWGFPEVMLEAVLLISMTVAIASSPRFARRGRRRSWSWVVESLGCIASAILCAILLMDHSLVTVLVHITIAGIALAWPQNLAPDVLATYGPARIAWFFDLTTAGVVSVLVSCGLVRLLSLWWWQGWRKRVCLGTLLAASLTVMVLLAGRIALVEVPGVTPVLAANIVMPTPSQLVIAAVLVLLLVSAAARCWSEPPVGAVAGSGTWRRNEQRYYHERRILLLLLAGVMLAACFRLVLGAWDWESIEWSLAGLITIPSGCLSLALLSLAVQSVFSEWPNRSGAVPIDRPRLAPGLFLLNWCVLLAIILASVPILAAWGFALWFRLA